MGEHSHTGPGPLDDRLRRIIAVSGAVPYEQSLPDRRFVHLGEGILALTGHRAEEMTSALWASLIEEVRPRGALAGGEGGEGGRRVASGEASEWQADYRIRTRDGQTRWIADSSVHVVDETGRPVAMVGVLQDVTARKAVEEALRLNSDRLALIARVTAAVVGQKPPEEQGRELAEQVRRAFGVDSCVIRVIEGRDLVLLAGVGVPEAQLVARLPLGFGISAEIVSSRRPLMIRDVREHPATKDAVRLQPNAYHFVSYAGAPMQVHDEVVGILGIFTAAEPREFAPADLEHLQIVANHVAVTVANDRLYKALVESRLLLEQAQAVAHIGTWFDHPRVPGRLVWSEETCRIFGLRPEEFDGRPETFFARVHPEDRERFEAEVTAAREREVHHAIDYRIIRPGGEVRWVHQEADILRDSEGHAQQAIGVVQDITDRHLAEVERREIETKIQEAQKLESLGILAGGIAHDFNNLLVSMLGHASLALMDLPGDHPARPSVEQIEVAAQRAADLTQQMLAYSGRGKFVVQPLDISRLVGEMAQLLEVSISKKATLSLHLAENLPLIEGDATQIRQVVMNLITNASDALGEEAGVISITTGLVEGEEAEGGGARVSVEVSDTGCGMDERTRQRIFDPFFTTKFTGRGLGLAAVLGIVRGHRGEIRVESTPGQGTTFRVTLGTVATASGSAAPAGPVREVTPPPVTTILLADDEEAVLSFCRRMLMRDGHRVLEARDGVEAVESVRAHPGEIDLILLDMTMPRMGGREAYEAIRALDPAVKVVLSSGFSESETVARFGHAGLAGFLHKPYSAQDLRAMVRDVLSKGA